MSASSGSATTLKKPPTATAVYQRLESREEAADWLTRTLAGQRIPALILTIGFGDGHLLDVLDAYGSQTKVLAFEPDAQSAERVKARRDLNGWHDSGRLRLLVGPAYDGADEAWRMFPAVVDDCAMLVHPHLLQGPATGDAVRVAQQIVAGARANAAARRKFAPRYLTNVLRNIPAMVDGNDVRALSDAYRGVPAIVAGAGPSLDSALPALAAYGDRAVLFAVDTALRPCLTAGIQPHFVVGADPGTLNARHFQWLPECGKTWLIAESALDRSATEVFDGRTLFFRVSRHHPWPWLQQWGCDAGQIDMWGSVLTAGFGAAVLAGCDPIVVVGADLAFTDGQPYARGTTYEFDWSFGEAIGIALMDWWTQQISRNEIRTETDLRGRDTTTTTAMVSFRDWLAARMQKSGRRVVNASSGGILHGQGIVLGTVDGELAGLPQQQNLDPTSRLEIDRTGATRNGADRRTLRETARQAIEAARVAGGLSAPANPAPIPEWREFSGDGFDPVAVGAALQYAIDDLTRRQSAAPGTWTSTAIHAPTFDSALMRALPEGLRRWLMVEAAATAETAPAEAGRMLAPIARTKADRHRIACDALMLLNWIRSQAGAGASSDAELSAWAAGDRASWQTLPEPMRWGVALFDASLGHAAAEVPEDFQTDVPRREDVSIAVTDRSGSVALAVASRVRCWAEVIATFDEATCSLPDAAARLMLLERHLRAPRHHDGRLVNVSVTAQSGGRESARLDMPLDRSAIPHLFMGAIRETLPDSGGRASAAPDSTAPGAAAPDSGAPGATVVVRPGDGNLIVSVAIDGRADDGDGSGSGSDSGSGFGQCALVATRPRLIPQSGPPRSMVAYGVADGAVCLRFHSSESVVIANDATQRTHHRWPRGIIGELPLGLTGAVAWGNGRSIPDQITSGYVMYRTGADADVIVEDLPFRPVVGSWCGDRVYWSCLPSGVGAGADAWTGIASWAPGDTPRQELNGITTFDIHPTASGEMVLEPCSRRADDSIERHLATMAWRWRPGVAMQPFPLDELGASSHRSVADAWTATAYPHADAIRLERPDGRIATLLCPSPFRLVWCGDDLVVSTLSLELWRFADVRGMLDNFASGRVWSRSR